MKRAEITGANKPLAVKSYPVPKAPSKGFLLRTLYSGICHTDLHVIEDDISLGEGKSIRLRDIIGDRYIGLVPGHEICGEVLSLGADVGPDCGVKPGDTVMVYPWRGCRECENCALGDCQLCEHNKGTTTDFGKGPDNGGYTSHIAVPEAELAVKVPDGVPPQVACMLPCSALTSYTVTKRIRPFLEHAREIRGSANLLVIGAGGLGIWGIVLVRQVLKLDKVKIICADISREKLEAAKKAGADEVLVWPKGSSVDELVALSSGSGRMDAVIDYVGLPHTSQAGFYLLHTGGTLVPVGLHGGQLPIPIPLLIGRSIVVQGSRTGSLSSLKELVELITKASGNVEPPVMDFFNIEDVNTAVEKLYKGEIKGRAILTFD